MCSASETQPALILGDMGRRVKHTLAENMVKSAKEPMFETKKVHPDKWLGKLRTVSPNNH